MQKYLVLNTYTAYFPLLVAFLDTDSNQASSFFL